VDTAESIVVTSGLGEAEWGFDYSDGRVTMDSLESTGAVEDVDFGAELSDEDLGDILVREITIDGMCGVY
jgi:mycofactocin precursor